MATVECSSCRTSNPSEALYCSACGAPTHHSDGDDLIGVTVGGRYHLVEKIGQGSAGTLYRAEHVTLRRRMAVKLLHKQLALSEEAIERFRREAITVCEIDNDHIPQVHDFGRTDADQLFFAMEYLDGETLSAVLEREGRLSSERTADILTQIADGLMEAHTLGYVHRDLRPRSIFLTRRRGRQDFVKILDFGLAKLVQPEVDAQRTAMGMTYGDPRYMAPEQARGEVVDRRADIYSLGALGFEMLVGEPPFKGGGTFEVLQKVLDAPVPRVRDRRTDCPPWLESVVRTALAKRSADRFQTVAQLLDALERKQVLANQPPMPVQLTSQQANKLAGVNPSAPGVARGSVPGTNVQVFVSSPSLRPPPVVAEPVPPTNTTQTMPTVAPGNRAAAQSSAQGAVAPTHTPAAAAPRMTLSYPTSKLARSTTLPGVNDGKSGPNKADWGPEPAASPAASKANVSGELRLLNERLPQVAPKSVPPTQSPAKAAPTPAPSKIAPTPRPAPRAAEPIAKPVVIAQTTPARMDPTPRTARALLEKEAMAWEEAAMPALATSDLTDSARMSDNAGRAASADTPVEAMKFSAEAEAPSAASPPPEPSAPMARPISAPVIAAMRSMSHGAIAAKANETAKAQSVAAESSKASDRTAATKPAAAAQQPTARAPEVAPVGVLGASPDDGDESDTGDATIPHIRSHTHDEQPAAPAAASSKSPVAASTRSPAPASTRSPVAAAPVAAATAAAAAAAPAAAAPAAAAPAATAAAAPAEIPAVAKPAAAAEPPPEAPKSSDEPTVKPTSAGPDSGGKRKGGAEAAWFSTPAASATDSFAADDGDMTVTRRGLPKWALPAVAGGLLVLGIVFLASRPSSPPPVVPPPTTSGVPTPTPPPPTPTPPGTTTTPEVTPTPPPATAPVVTTPTATPDKPATEGPAAKAGPEVVPMPVATALPSTSATPGAEKTTPHPTPEVSALGVETKPATPDHAAGTPATPATTDTSKAAPAEPKGKTDGDKRAGKGPAGGKTKGTAVAKTDAEPKTASKPTAAPGEEPEDKPGKAEKKPSDAMALVRNAKKKLDDGEPEAAVALYTRAVELDPKSAEAVGGLGEASFEQGNFDAAVRHLNKAAKLAPRRSSYQELLAQALYKVGRYKDAAEACRKLLKQNPNSAKAKQTLELAEKKLGTASDN